MTDPDSDLATFYGRSAPRQLGLNLMSKQLMISTLTFGRSLIEHLVMLILQLYVCSCRDEANHREFKNSCSASLVRFSADSNALVVLVSQARVGLSPLHGVTVRDLCVTSLCYRQETVDEM